MVSSKSSKLTRIGSSTLMTGLDVVVTGSGVLEYVDSDGGGVLTVVDDNCFGVLKLLGFNVN